MTKKVLVVDDEPTITLSVKEGLEYLDADFNVTCVKSGEECIDLLKKNQLPDLILLDIMMPGMNGWDVAAEIKKNPEWNRIPVVFLTAKTDSDSKSFGKIVSQDYVEKPFEIKDLKNRIDKLLGY
jgi:CheY-like chemotaxis protein